MQNLKLRERVGQLTIGAHETQGNDTNVEGRY